MPWPSSATVSEHKTIGTLRNLGEADKSARRDFKALSKQPSLTIAHSPLTAEYLRGVALSAQQIPEVFLRQIVLFHQEADGLGGCQVATKTRIGPALKLLDQIGQDIEQGVFLGRSLATHQPLDRSQGAPVIGFRLDH